MGKQVVVASLVSAIAGGLIGGAITYVVVKKTFAERAQRDIDEVKQAYHERFDGKRVVSVYPEVDPETIKTSVSNITKEDIADARDFVQNLGYQVENEEDKAPLAEKPKGSEDEDVSIYDRQVKKKKSIGKEVESKLLVGYDREGLRKAHKPYLISKEEFDTTETEWSKVSIDYYEDDDTLTDENNIPIDDIDYAIGEQHLDFFGIRSEDPNIVFIRSPQISTDYEITRNSSSYTEVVLGEPKGADTLGTRRGDNG